MVKVYFSNRQLYRAYMQARRAERNWGKAVGTEYIRVIDMLISAPSISALYDLAHIRFHPLAGNRKGQFGLTLHGLVRLVVTVDEDEQAIELIEVGDYH